MNRRNCEICNVDVHRASYCRHLRSEIHSIKELKIQMERVKNFINTERMTLKTTNGVEIEFNRDRVNQFCPPQLAIRNSDYI